MIKHPPITGGQRFGRLTAIEPLRDEKNRAMIRCICDCGRMHSATPSNLRSGHVSSCGCLRKELAAKNHRTHGMFGTRLYGIWVSMHKRCRGTSTAQHRRLYRDRGIRVCEEWGTFEPFMQWAVVNGYADTLTIDRIDNDGNYCPLNCRWATLVQQANNNRNNHRLTLYGVTKNINQWAEEYGLKWTTLHERLRRGWTVEDAITKPLMRIHH